MVVINVSGMRRDLVGMTVIPPGGYSESGKGNQG